VQRLVAVLGVRDPQRTIPRAIPTALVLTVIVYRVWRHCQAGYPPSS